MPESEDSTDVRVELRFDTQGDSYRRVVAVAVDAFPQPLLHILGCEGLWNDGPVWVGPLESFRSALQRIPRQYEAHRRALAQTLGLTGMTRVLQSDVSRTLVMGVLNVTPDSFYDGGRYTQVEQAVQQAMRMVEEGADIIDVGGESTRPNADPVPLDEELRRVVPVIRALAAEVDVKISIDTYKAAVADAAIKAGATIVNDISGLQFDPRMAETIAAGGAAAVLMHTRGTPRDMQRNPRYEDVVREVREYLSKSCEAALDAGVMEERIWIDPGIGFGKTLEHNLSLLSQLRSLRSLGFPILVGTSNKSMIGQVLNLGVTERLEGTAATVALAIANGADAVRVHDVRAMRRVALMTDAVVRGRWVGSR